MSTSAEINGAATVGLNGANTAGKIAPLDDLAAWCAQQKAQGCKVVLAHGVFDLLHIGHLRHLKLARAEGDFLVVSLTADRFVNKGPGRPVFADQVRAEMLASLDVVDRVVVSDFPSAEEVITALAPSIYVKGAEYKDAGSDITGKIIDERRAIESVGGKLVFTDDVVYSSSALINRFLDIYDPKLRDFLLNARETGFQDRVSLAIDALSKLRVLFVGETIIDEYNFVQPMGKTPKENIIANRFLNREIYAGGVIAAANHAASLCAEVAVITSLGEADSHEQLVHRSLKPNVHMHAVFRPNSPTTRKSRFVDPSYYRKLFEVYHFEDKPMDEVTQQRVDTAIARMGGDYDLVVVTDFGHAFVAPSTIETLQKSARFLAVNAQSNSGNFGYNLITRYNRADLICIDEGEARLATADKFSPVEDVVRNKLASRVDCDRFIVTKGKMGCVTYKRDGALNTIPAFTSTVVDTVGAGDAFLSVASPLIAAGADLDVAGFIGNAVGAMKVNIVGHRQSVERAPLLKYLTALLK